MFLFDSCLAHIPEWRFTKAFSGIHQKQQFVGGGPARSQGAKEVKNTPSSPTKPTPLPGEGALNGWCLAVGQSIRPAKPVASGGREAMRCSTRWACRSSGLRARNASSSCGQAAAGPRRAQRCAECKTTYGTRQLCRGTAVALLRGMVSGCARRNGMKCAIKCSF